jgi:hypothetical protein
MAKTVVSKQFSLDARDWWRGLIIAALTPVFFIVQQSIDKGELVFNWKTIGMAALGGGLAYLAKNFLLEPPKVITKAESNLKAVNAAEKIKQTV